MGQLLREPMVLTEKIVVGHSLAGVPIPSDGYQLLKKQFNYNYFFNYLVVVKLSS